MLESIATMAFLVLLLLISSQLLNRRRGERPDLILVRPGRELLVFIPVLLAVASEKLGFRYDSSGSLAYVGQGLCVVAVIALLIWVKPKFFALKYLPFAGALMNALVILLNGYRMPINIPGYKTQFYASMTSSSILPFLGDWIRTGWISASGWVSPGDIVMMIALPVGLYQLIREFLRRGLC